MSLWTSLTQWASRAWRTVSGGPGGFGGRFASIWHFITNVGQIIDWTISHPFTAMAVELRALAAVLTLNGKALQSANARLNAYIFNTQTQPTRTWALRQLTQVRRLIWDLNGLVIQFVRAQIVAARRYARRLVHSETAARRRAVRRAEARARREARRVLQTVQRQAVSGYSPSRAASLGLVGRLLDLAVSRDPLVRDIVGKAAAAVVDLAKADSLPERLLLQWLVGELVKRLGVEKPIGDLLRQLAGPLLDAGRPQDLHAVIRDIARRLDAAEAWQADFMAHGGPEIFQAGEQWSLLDSLAVDAALLGFAAVAIADPGRAAADVSALIRPVGQDVITGLASVLTRG